MIRQILIAGVSVFLTAHAEAASFDCKKAKTEVEETICSDRDLSKTDERVVAAYRDALSKLSLEGQRILREGQRRWLKTLPKGCYYDPTDLRVCLNRAYDRRLRDLESAAVIVGKYVFSRVDFYDTASAVNGVGARHIFNSHTAYPRIDSPLTADTRKWNLTMEKNDGFQVACGLGNVDVGFDVEKTGKTSLIMRFWTYEYCTNMAHGFGETTFANIDVGRSLEPLTALDLFNKDSDWLGFLVQRSIGELPDGADEGVVAGVVENSENWMIEKDRLTIIFPSYTVAGYPSYSVIASWKILRPYLRPDAPIPK